jgi:hypothetical protein
MELTYGRAGEFGFDHGHCYDVRPASVPSYTSYGSHNYFGQPPNQGAYVDFHAARKEVVALGEYFKAAAAAATAAKTKQVPKAGIMRTWADIVKA